MSEKKQKKKQSRTRRIVKAVLWTAGIFLLLIAFACLAAVLTVDRWIVPVCAWYTGVEVEGEPDVKVSLSDRELVLSGLKLNFPAGQVEIRSYGFRLDGIDFEDGALKEVRVSRVRLGGVRASLDFSALADAPAVPDFDTISEEKVRRLSRAVWTRASKPVVRMTDLKMSDAEVSWKSGATQSRITVSGLDAEFENGNLTRPRLSCVAGYRLNDSQRAIRVGARIEASALEDGDGVTVSAAGVGPLVIELPDSRLEFPALESAGMIVQYEPGSANTVRFGGEWKSPGRWEYKALNLSLDKAKLNLDGVLALDGEKLRLQFGADASGTDLICRDSVIPGDVLSGVKGNLGFDLVSGGVTLDSFSGHLTGPAGGRIDFGTSGMFEFVRHEDATYTLNPQAAKLTFSTGRPVDLTPFDPVLPFEAADRELVGDYFIELDPEKNCLHGGTDVTIRNPKTQNRVFAGNAEFETDGVDRIGSFHVSRCGLEFFDGEDRICGAHFTGEYNIRTASLNGEANYYPYRMIETFGSPGLADTRIFLNDANLSGTEHAAAVDLKLDLVNMTAKLHNESHLSHLALTGSGGRNLDLDAVGDADFMLAPDERGWQMECGLDLKAGNDFHAVLHAAGGSDTSISGEVEVKRLSDVFARQLENKIIPGNGGVPFLRFLNLSASAEFRFDQEDSRLTLTRLDADIDNGDGRVEFRGGSDFVLENGTALRLPVDFKLKTAGLPVSFLEPLLADSDDFKLAGGVLTSELDLHVDEDGRTVFGEEKLVGTGLTVLLYGQPYELARIGANGTFLFDRDSRFMILPEMNLDIQDRQARQTLFASGSGTVDLADECRTRMTCSEVRFGPEILYLIGYGVERSFYFEDLDAAGEIEFRAEKMFREMSWTGGMKINRLRLQSDEPDEYRFPELSGGLDGWLSWADDDLYGDAAIRLADSEGVEHVSGRYLYRRDGDAKPKFISSSLDLPFAVSCFRYNHNTDPSAEKSALKLFDRTFDLDLHGIYARNHSLIFSMSGLLDMRGGDDSALLVPHAEFSGDVSGHASAEIRVKNGSWPFSVEADLSNIPFDRTFAAFLATDDNPEIPHGLHGIVSRLKAVVHGEGFTTEALARNLQVDCKAELEDVSLRSSLRDRSFFLNILLLPLVSVPRLIDYVPGEMVRRALRLATAGAITDMISGEEPIEFRRGTMELSLRHGVVDLKKIELEGELLENYRAHGTIDFAGTGEAELETVTRFAFFFWPFFLNGNILDPKVSYGKSISHFFSDNAKYLLTLFPNMILSAFSEEDAEEIDRLEAEKEQQEAEKGQGDSEKEQGDAEKGQQEAEKGRK